MIYNYLVLHQLEQSFISMSQYDKDNRNGKDPFRTKMEEMQSIFGVAVQTNQHTMSQDILKYIHNLKSKSLKIIAMSSGIAKWANGIQKEKRGQIFAICSQENVQRIICKLKHNADLSYEQDYESGDEDEEQIMEREQSWMSKLVDLNKIKIGWISRPVIYADSDWALQHLQKMIYQYHYRHFQQKQSLSKQDQSQYCTIQELIVISLVEELMQRYKSNCFTSRLADVLNIWDFAINQLDSSELYMMKIFSMSLAQAKEEEKLFKYSVSAKEIQDQYYESLRQKALSLLDLDQKGKGLKKPKKKRTKVNKTVQEQPQKPIQQNKSIIDQTRHMLSTQEMQNTKNCTQKDIEIDRKYALLQLDKLLKTKLQQIYVQNAHIARLKNTAIQMILNFLANKYPAFIVNIFGSFITQTSLPNSDIDLLLTPIKYEGALALLYQIANDLALYGCVTYCKIILGAKVPIIKLILDTFTNEQSKISPYKTLSLEQQKSQPLLVKMDITLNINNSGLISTSFIHGIVSAQAKFRNIFLLVKYLFSADHLNEGYFGGFSSYPLFIMIISFIEHKQVDMHEVLLSQLFIKFFHFFVNEFDPATHILRFAKNKSSLMTLQEYKSNAFSEEWVKDTKLRLMDPISGRLISASFSKYDEMTRLFSKWLQTFEAFGRKYSQIIDKAHDEGENKISLSQKLSATEQMGSLMNMIGL